MNLKARLLAAALACAALAAPDLASAASRHARARHSGHASAPSFPMKADEYKKFSEERIERVRGVIDKKLDRRGVSAERKKAIHKIFDEAAREVHAEVGKAVADGKVTQAEADKVKTLTNGLRARVRERLRAGKDPKGKEKAPRDEATKKEKPTQEARVKKAHAAGEDKGRGASSPTVTARTAKGGAKSKPAGTRASDSKKASTAKHRKPAQAETGADL